MSSEADQGLKQRQRPGLGARVLIPLEHTAPEVTVQLCHTRLAPAPTWSHLQHTAKAWASEQGPGVQISCQSKGSQRTRQGNEQKTLTGELSGP